VDGGDVVFQDFGNGEARVALEWDNWMGFQVVARSVESEPLVAAIAAFLGGGTDERPSRWRPLSREQIENELAAAVSSLHATHAARFAKLRVPLRLAPVTAHPGESVWVVAEHEGQMLYYSDVEGGWAIARANAAGGIADRDGSQLELSHVMTQLFGDPEQGSR
jgi:hypothetical protein